MVGLLGEIVKLMSEGRRLAGEWLPVHLVFSNSEFTIKMKREALSHPTFPFSLVFSPL